MTLEYAELDKEYKVSDIITDDEDLKRFLFSLGCYSGEPLTIVNRKKNNLVLSIKDSRYNIDINLAKAISVAS